MFKSKILKVIFQVAFREENELKALLPARDEGFNCRLA